MVGFAESLVALKKEQAARPPKPLRTKPSIDPVRRRDLSAVYIQDDAYAWLPASVVQTDGNKVTVSVSLPRDWHTCTVLSKNSKIQNLEEALLGGGGENDDDDEKQAVYRTVSLLDYPRNELPLQNRSSSLGKRDMADLPFLHEAAILYNLKQRHFYSQPYTRVGDIVVAMNPFTWMNHLYNQETRDLYAKSLVWEAKDDDDDMNDDDTIGTFGSVYDKLGFDPHVYETSCLAYKGLAMSGDNQTILVSGESGAGKTETVKIVMSHLATLEQSRPNHMEKGENETVITRVLESSPVFEAFGNAKTLRNDNSSRFGKFTQLQFKVDKVNGEKIPSCSLAGSVCVTYLLEKSRVVSHSPGERTYHVFYQLLSAPDSYKREIWSELEHATVDDFSYLVPCATDTIDGVSDQDTWPRTLEALEVFNFKGERLLTLLRALCIVLQLGNLTFDHDPAADHEEGGTVITSIDELDKLSALMGIPSQVLESCMTMRLIKTGYDQVNVQLRPSVAKESCDALAKEVYHKVFDVIVREINDYTRAETHYKHEYGLISLLDIFGFERFKVNRFEQLCINYANEQLQHKYVLDNFRQVQQEYEAEGIEIFDFKVVDNSDVLNLLEGRLGLIISLNEECVRPKGNDESYVYKIKIVHKEHERLIDEKLHRRTEFGVKHFAGPVTYDSTKFVERNTDKLPEGLMHCAAKSTNQLIRDEFEQMIATMEQNETPGAQRKKKQRTVLEKFRVQLKSLMASMEGTTTRYIRCIKPNETMTPKMTDHYHTMRQLECAGLVTAIAISRESFPNRLGYDAIRDRFECLMDEHDLRNIASMGKKDSVNYMLSNLLPSMADVHGGTSLTLPFACGKTRVYFRAGALEHLETMRLDYYTKHTVVIQRWIRKIQAKRRFLKMKETAVKIQALARCRIESRRYREQKAAALTVQCWCRKLEATALVKEMRFLRAVIKIQSRFRARYKKRGLERFKRATRLIQHAIRNRKKKTVMTAKLAIAVEEARMDNKLRILREKVSVCSMSGRSPDEDLLLQVESMLDYMKNELYALRGTNSELRAELAEKENCTRELEMHAESTEAAASSSRLEIAQLTKANAQLVQEMADYKHDMLAMRKEMKSCDSSRVLELEAIQADHEQALKEREMVVAAMQKTMEKSHRHCEREKKMLKERISKLEEVHKADRVRLKDELKRTQDSHHEYLAKLMDVLDTTHAAREEETARISEELNAVKEEKDALIIKLQKEVESLRQGRKGDAAVIRDDLKRKEREMASIRKETEKNARDREDRSQKFFEVALSLETMLSQGGSPTKSDKRRRSITGGSKKPKAPSEEDVLRMKQMVRYLGDLYSLEENSQSQTDTDLVAKVDEYLATSGPKSAMAELEVRVGSLEQENLALRQQVQELSSCRRCEARDQRRRERESSSRSLHKKNKKERRGRSKD